MAFLEECSGLDPWKFGSARLKAELKEREVVEVPPMDQWRVKYLADLLGLRQTFHYMGDKEGEMAVIGLIDSLCIN